MSVLESQVLNTHDDSLRTRLIPFEMNELDLEAIEPASEHLAASFKQLALASKGTGN